MKKSNDYISALEQEILFYEKMINDDTMDYACTMKYKIMLKGTKERFVKSHHNYSIRQQAYTRQKGEKYYLWTTTILDDEGNSKKITAKKYDNLIDKLYDHYSTSYLLSEVFTKWIKWKSEEAITGKSLMEYNRLWNKYYSTNEIAEKDIRRITAKDWQIFFRECCVKYKLTKKQFNQLKIVATGINSYCLDPENEIISKNPLLEINYHKLPYVKEANNNQIKAKPFPQSQIDKIITWCENQLLNPRVAKIYYYVIMFNVFLGLRFGELAGLRWYDVDFESKQMIICGQSVLDYQMNDDLTFTSNHRKRIDHVKAYEDERIIGLTDSDIEILKKVKALNLNSENVFPMRYHTLNEKIKLCADALGLNPEQFRTHCMRSTAATNVYYSCNDIKTVQKMLGHSNVSMTAKYIYNIEGLDSMRDAREKAIQKHNITA